MSRLGSTQPNIVRQSQQCSRQMQISPQPRAKTVKKVSTSTAPNSLVCGRAYPLKTESPVELSWGSNNNQIKGSRDASAWLWRSTFLMVISTIAHKKPADGYGVTQPPKQRNWTMIQRLASASNLIAALFSALAAYHWYQAAKVHAPPAVLQGSSGWASKANPAPRMHWWTQYRLSGTRRKAAAETRWLRR